MWNATQHISQCNFLYCGLNVQIQMIQDRSSYCHENNNTSIILTKQSCLLKIAWLKKVNPTKSYSLAMLYLHHIKYLIMHNPDDKPSNCFILQYSQTFSIFMQYMSVSCGHSTICAIEWWLWRRQKEEDSLTSTRRINGLWRCPSIDINVSEQGLPCNGCTRAISV